MGERNVQKLLQTARSRLNRLTPRQALRAQQQGAYLVDIRPHYQRQADGDIPTAIVIERNHLEWRLDPCSPSHIPEAVSHDLRWIVICDQGYSSSLAAASLKDAGMHKATDVDGGFQRWRSEGCPVIHSDPPASPRVARHDTRIRLHAEDNEPRGG